MKKNDLLVPTTLYVTSDSLHAHLAFKSTGEPVTGYNITVAAIASILRCSRRYVALNVQPHLRYVKIPALTKSDPDHSAPPNFREANIRANLVNQLDKYRVGQSQGYTRLW